MDLTLVSQDTETALLKIKGRITQRQIAAATTDLLVDLLGPEAYTRKILLDMREAEFLDSSGISWLLIAHKRCREQGGRLVLFGVTPMVMNVFKVLRMQLVFDLTNTYDEARKVAVGGAA